MITKFIKKIIGSKHDRTIKRLLPTVEEINRIEREYQGLTDDQLRSKTDEFKARLQGGESTDDLLPEAFATAKNACRRMVGSEVNIAEQSIVWDMIPYDVQLLGGIALHDGGIAEMQTGEGKTLVAILPLYLNALTGRNCQLVTVNDYLARRDSLWVGSVLKWLGLTVGCIEHTMTPDQRREQYGYDVTYGTNSEFGFDYLRDMGMATNSEDVVQRDHFFAIVDEIDSILIDEARTPLIISGPVAVSTHRYDQLKPSVENLVRKQLDLCNKLVNDARDELKNEDASEGSIDIAMDKLLRVKLGIPKHKQLNRLLEDPAIRRKLDKTEMESHSDQNRAMLYEIKEFLYFTIDEKANDTDLSEKGRTALRPDDPESFTLPDLVTGFQEIDSDTGLTETEKSEARTNLQRLFDERSETIHNISQLLRAYCLFEPDVHYVVKDNKVQIVDEFTGRLMPGRRFSEGLHQALEAKEGVTIERETQTLASITIQNYFRMYDKLAGMTGTAETEATELRDIYGLDVLVIPTNRPCVRRDENDRVFKTRREKYNSMISEIKECHGKGQPVLLGTISVEVSELLSRMLKRERIPHTVLNAKNHQSEAEIVARAGARGAVTIATNMAGRGTDIRLGPGVADLGGLHVIASERHDSRRIDRQLRGRCARQGDLGSSRFYIALEDDLMRLFGSDRIAGLMEKFGFEEGEELSHPLLNRSIEGAQKKVEQHHYSIRKRTLQFDDVVNKQRQVIYGRRKEILETDKPHELLFDFVDNAIYDHLEANSLDVKTHGYPFDKLALSHWFGNTFPITLNDEDLTVDPNNFDTEKLVSALTAKVETAYNAKVKREDPEYLSRFEKHIILTVHDKLWQEHLYAMDDLRGGIYLRAHAQRDPLVEYKQEAFQMFGELIGQINNDIAMSLFRSSSSVSALQQLLSSLPQQEVHRLYEQFSVGQQQAEPGDVHNQEESAQPRSIPKGITIHRDYPKIGRNDPCPCGSGKKFKKCCGR